MRRGENGLAEVQPRPTRLPFMHPPITHHHHLIPVYLTTTGFSLPYMETPRVSFTKTEPWRLGFAPSPSLALHPITSPHHLNPGLSHPNQDPSTRSGTTPPISFAKKRALAAQFWFLTAPGLSLALDQIVCPHHPNPSVPHPNEVTYTLYAGPPHHSVTPRCLLYHHHYAQPHPHLALPTSHLACKHPGRS